METRYLTLKAAAKAAGCSVKTLRRAIAAGSLKVYRPEGVRAWRVRPDDLITWVEGTRGEEQVPSAIPQDDDMFAGGDGITFDEDSPEAALVPKRR